METKRRNFVVSVILVGVWVLIAAWQVTDHIRVQNLARAELIHRARDVSTTVGTTVRLLRRFGGVVSKERLESALTELLRPGEWDGIALFNEAGDVVASAGTPVELPFKGLDSPEIWTNNTVILMNPVALGTNVTRDLEGTNVPVIVDFHRPPDTNRPPPPPDPGTLQTNGSSGGAMRPESPSPRPERGMGPGGRPPRFTRPPWWSEQEWKSISEKQGVHSFAVVMSTRNFEEASRRDVRSRVIIILLATISVLGSGLAWGNLAKSADLQIRLVRASELNTHLKEMNLAAAGLAHETRNPLNIVRGLAQLISRQPEAPAEIRDKSKQIIDETDKVTAQLNEFINYSRPRELRRSVLALRSVLSEVVGALAFDIEEKKIQVAIKGEALSIEADEQQLRQVLFNLLLNAIQAVDAGGSIEIFARSSSPTEGLLEVRDNGPGVPEGRRTEIFKPYFTTQEKGTGLGLAIVQQIVLAHGWEIACFSNDPKGALFRITHLRLAVRH
jgi:signal transduction histidine kinase